MSELREKTIKESETVMTEMIMPNDTNPLGNLMGGNLMRWMDMACGICAARHCGAHVVTASVDHVSFHAPIKEGQVITLTATVTRSFTTSVEIYVEVTVADMIGSNARKSNHAYLTFVALHSETKKPIPAHPVRPITSTELKLYESAIRRRELRLILSGRMKPEEATEIKDFFADK